MKFKFHLHLLRTTMLSFLTDLFNDLIDKQHEVSKRDNFSKKRKLTRLTQRYRLVATLVGHGGPINAFSFNLSGSLLASGGDDERVRIWDFNAFRQYQTLADHGGTWGQITCIKFLRLNGEGSSEDLICFGTGRGCLLLYHRQRKVVGVQNDIISTGY